MTCAVVLGLALGLAACGDTAQVVAPEGQPAANTGKDPAEPADAGAGDDLPAPPAVRVRYGDEYVDLDAWTFCNETGCVDSFPPKDLHDVGSSDQIEFEFPLQDWKFDAYFQPAGNPCARTFPGKAEQTAPGRWVLRPAGYAGEYDVSLFGRGPEGDTSVTFRWTTPTDGDLPSPSSYVGIIAGYDGDLDSYGVEMQVSQLAETPEEADATITVTAANGESLTFSPHLTTSQCNAEGNLWWDGPNAKGKEAAELGPAPFTYDVELVLDGRVHKAHARWPDDEIRGNGPTCD